MPLGAEEKTALAEGGALSKPHRGAQRSEGPARQCYHTRRAGHHTILFLYAISDTALMCSDPQNNSFAPSGKVACRKCNQCITAYKNDWIARGMAEKAYLGNAFVLTLTYANNPDGTLSDSARAFRYKDVQDFLKRVRKAYKKHYKATGEISYIVAGELGSLTKRVHWHMVIFSKRPIHDLGEWSTCKGQAMAGPKITLKGWNQRWSLWTGHGSNGHVSPQIPDQGGVAYVLKYAMKDMFNVVKSEGTARFTKSERHASGMFRMAKQPPIGWRYLQQKITEWEARGDLPISLHLKVPEYSGYWWPKGPIRRAALKALHDINHGIREKTGRDAPQWDSLLLSVDASETDTQFLQQRKKQGDFDHDKITHDAEWQADVKRKTLSTRASLAAQLEPHTRCKEAALKPSCAQRLSKTEWAHYQRWFEIKRTAACKAQGRTLSASEFSRYWAIQNKGKLHPFCTCTEQ